jgi:hypothetical protein
VTDEQGATITVTAPPAKGDKRTGEQKRIEDLFQAVNPGDSIKIRHELRADQGKHVRPLTAILRDFNGVTDLEQHIYETGCQQGWKSGDYMIELCRPGHQGAVKYGFFSFTFPERPAPAVAAVMDPLAMLERAKGILGNGAPQASPDAALSAVTQAMKVGAESAKPSGVNSETLAVLKPVLEKLVDRLMEKPAAPATPQDPIATMRGMVGALRELGLIGEPNGGAADEPKTLREQLAEVKELADTFGGFGGRSASEPTAVAIAKVLAPVAEKIVPQILATVNNLADVWRLRLTAGAGGPVPVARVAPPAPIAMPPAVTALVANAQAAVARDDDGFFGAFADGIAAQIPDGRGFLEAVHGGQVEEEQALAVVQASGLLNAQEPKTRAWLLRFVHWLRRVGPPAAAPASPPLAPKIMGRCGTCGADYEFESRQQFDDDSRICDEQRDGQPCAGMIGLAEESK